MSAFDANQFLDVNIVEANTKRPPLDVADYNSTIKGITTASGEKDNKPWVQMLIQHELEVPMDQRERVGTDKVTLTDRVFLDLTDQGMLDNSVGKNRGQRQYRDATGLNNPGEAFSWRMLEGRQVRIKLKHDMYQDEVQEKIAGVAKI